MRVYSFLVPVVIILFCICSASAAETGVLKICSKPVNCEVVFEGKRLTKNRAVLTLRDIKPGVYSVAFESSGRRLVKKARVEGGETTIIFGSIDSPAAVNIDNAAIAGSGSAATSLAAKESDPLMVAPKGVVGSSVTRSAGAKDDYDENAAITFELAEIIRNNLNPFTASKRYQKALELYSRIVEIYPESQYLERSNYAMGRIYESVHVRDYNAAVIKYKEVLRLNPYSATDAASRIAMLYKSKLKEQADAELGGGPILLSSDDPAELNLQATPSKEVNR